MSETPFETEDADDSEESGPFVRDYEAMVKLREKFVDFAKHTLERMEMSWRKLLIASLVGGLLLGVALTSLIVQGFLPSGTSLRITLIIVGIVSSIGVFPVSTIVMIELLFDFYRDGSTLFTYLENAKNTYAHRRMRQTP